jgi:magnesium-transporting ATPase (P-type)
MRPLTRLPSWTLAHMQVVPAQFAGAPALLLLQRRRCGDSGASAAGAAATAADELFFEFRKQRFVYDASEGVFAQQRYPCDLSFASYAASRGHATASALAEALATFGENTFALPAPSFAQLLAEQLSAPFFVFQLFCVALWCFDEYWMYSLFTLAMLVVFEGTVAATRQRTACELRAQGAPAQGLMAYRGGAWCPLGAGALLPGDVVSVGRPRGGIAGQELSVLPADLLLLAGSAITEEALLTGETAPQWKTAAPGGGNNGAAANGGGGGTSPAAGAGANNGDAVLDMRRHRQHILFGGTKARVPAQPCMCACAHCVNLHVALTTDASPPEKAGRAARGRPFSAAAHAGRRLPGDRAAHRLRHRAGARAARRERGLSCCPCAETSTCFVGAQGKLMRTIMFSTESVSANSREAGLFILLLLVFAITAAGCACMHAHMPALRSCLPDVHQLTCIRPPVRSLPTQLRAAPRAGGPAAQSVEALPAHHHDCDVRNSSRAAA